MRKGYRRATNPWLLVVVGVCLATYAAPGGAVVGGVEIVAEDMGQALPGATITIFSGEDRVAQEETDRTAVALILLEEGEYGIVIEVGGKTIRDTIVVGPGVFTSLTADSSASSLSKNDEPMQRYRPVDGALTEPGYRVRTADLDGVMSVKMDAPEGTIYLSIPTGTEAGETVSWSAVVVPSGTTPEKRDKNESRLRDHKLVVGDKQFRLTSNPAATIKVSPELEVSLTGRKGKRPVISASLRPGLRAPGQASETVDSAPGETAAGFSVSCEETIMASAGWPVHIPGVFDGLAGNTIVTIGGKPVRVEAETGSGVIISAPTWSVGLTNVRIGEGGEQAECSMRSVGLDLSADKVDLLSGETTTMRLKVRGLGGIEQPSFVALVNRSRTVISMSGGDSQLLTINPADVSGSGEFNLVRTLTGIRRGSFHIDAVLK